MEISYHLVRRGIVMKDEERLPLFPLHVVLFPESLLPLHIFEERYKVLINRCVGTEEEFGVNFAMERNIAVVGCTAVVENVLRRYPDGQLDIVVRGERRYTLDRYEQANPPYLVGVVRFLESGADVIDPKLAGATVALYNELVETVYKGSVNRLNESLAVEGISYRMAQKSGLTLEQRQAILEMETENDRLAYLHSYFGEVIPELSRIEQIQHIVQNDGYL